MTKMGFKMHTPDITLASQIGCQGWGGPIYAHDSSIIIQIMANIYAVFTLFQEISKVLLEMNLNIAIWLYIYMNISNIFFLLFFYCFGNRN